MGFLFHVGEVHISLEEGDVKLPGLDVFYEISKYLIEHLADESFEHCSKI